MIIPVIGVFVDGSVPAGTIPQRRPSIQDIDLPKQEDLLIKLAVLRQDGTPQDITGWTIKLGVRKEIDSASPVVTKTVGPGSLTTPLQGLTDIVISSSDTAMLLQRYRYHYDIHGLLVASTRTQLVPVSTFRIAPIAHRPGEV
jgi:hypothetical protein